MYLCFFGFQKFVKQSVKLQLSLSRSSSTIVLRKICKFSFLSNYILKYNLKMTSLAWWCRSLFCCARWKDTDLNKMLIVGINSAYRKAVYRWGPFSYIESTLPVLFTVDLIITCRPTGLKNWTRLSTRERPSVDTSKRRKWQDCQQFVGKVTKRQGATLAGQSTKPVPQLTRVGRQMIADLIICRQRLNTTIVRLEPVNGRVLLLQLMMMMMIQQHVRSR